MWLILSFCGGAYPKFEINLEWLLTREILVLKYNYGYNKVRGIFAMFLLVSMPLEFVTGGLSGSPWWTFNFFTTFWPNLKITLCTSDTVHTRKNSKDQKSRLMCQFLFHKELIYVTQFENLWCLVVKQAVPKLTGWFNYVSCTGTIHTSTVQITVFFSFVDKILDLFHSLEEGGASSSHTFYLS